MVQCLPTMRETQIQSLGQEDLLEKDMATHSSTLAWKIPWTKQPSRLQSMGSKRVRHNWVSSLHSLLKAINTWQLALERVQLSLELAYCSNHVSHSNKLYSLLRKKKNKTTWLLALWSATFEIVQEWEPPHLWLWAWWVWLLNVFTRVNCWSGRFERRT